MSFINDSSSTIEDCDITVMPVPDDNLSGSNTTPKLLFNQDSTSIVQERCTQVVPNDNGFKSPMSTSSPYVDIHRYINPLANMHYLSPNRQFDCDSQLDVSFDGDTSLNDDAESLIPTMPNFTRD